MRFCGMPECDNEAVVTVPVSTDVDAVVMRRLCHPCAEAYAVGCQHGRFRAVRILRGRAAELDRAGNHAGAARHRLAAGDVDAGDDPGLGGAVPEDDEPELCECGRERHLCTSHEGDDPDAEHRDA